MNTEAVACGRRAHTGGILAVLAAALALGTVSSPLAAGEMEMRRSTRTAPIALSASDSGGLAILIMALAKHVREAHAAPVFPPAPARKIGALVSDADVARRSNPAH